jgi:2',3'-cyclic-nucleotide 2'-phosphodiesterase / 3'-nucleotidase
MKRRFLLAKYAIILLLISFCSSNLYSQADSIRLKIVETSDVHGAIVPFDFVKNKKAYSSLANVATYVNQERAKKQELILLDDGDILQGQPIVYYYNFIKTTSPHICSQVMNYMNYDAGTVGNHDIEPGHDVYDKINKEFNFPWLAANAINKKTNEPYFKPYTVIERNGLKIAVLGLITPYIPNWLPENIWSGIEFEDMILTAKKWVPVILEKEKPDLLVGLFHSGVEYTYNDQDANTFRNENASQLVAEQVPGFDIVFVGHDHKGWNEWIKTNNDKKVLVLGTQSEARNIAVATIDFIRNKQTNTYSKNFSGELIESNKYAPDKEFSSNFSGAEKEVKAFTSKKIAQFSDSITTRESMFGNSAFVDLIHQIQLEYTGADVSFSAPLSFDATIKKGAVFVSDMFNLYRYENLLYKMKMSGKEIKDYLEYSFSIWFSTMKSPEDHLLLFKKDDKGNLIKDSHGKSYQLKGQYYNYCAAAGIKYTVDVTKEPGDRVNVISMQNGDAFDLNKTYTVAMNSYRGNGGGGLLIEGAKIPKDELKNRLISSTTKDLRFYIIEWMQKHPVFTPTSFGNWKVIPEDFWIKAKEKDYGLIYKD